MPRLEQSPPEDFRSVLREKALNHSLFYLKLGGASAQGNTNTNKLYRAGHSGAGGRRESAPHAVRIHTIRELPSPRQLQPRISELLRRFEPAPMQYLRPPRAPSPGEDIASSDDDDRAAVRRRSRDLSDDSAVELEPRPRRHSVPRIRSLPIPRAHLTLVEAQDVRLDSRRDSGDGEEGRPRCVRTPSVVVSDYSSETTAGATPEELAWLRARSLSADSACSSCSTLSSRDDEELESPTMPKKVSSFY